MDFRGNNDLSFTEEEQEAIARAAAGQNFEIPGVPLPGGRFLLGIVLGGVLTLIASGLHDSGRTGLPASPSAAPVILEAQPSHSAVSFEVTPARGAAFQPVAGASDQAEITRETANCSLRKQDELEALKVFERLVRLERERTDRFLRDLRDEREER